MKTSGDRSFGYAAPTLWKKLPCSIRSLNSWCNFKQSLEDKLILVALLLDIGLMNNKVKTKFLKDLTLEFLLNSLATLSKFLL